ncbi:MAG: (2Fe-2S)-binding protein [Deltaproteobacteria bacterium]|nr:(2Fe-2S)-binding protein [Deltaproteobacteria bacterium]
MQKHLLTMRVNGEQVELAVRPNATLLDVLREDLELTGVKEGCSEGACGACAVLMNNEPIRSCLTLALEANGAEILTIEGLATGGRLHPLQEAFVEQGAVQCGFCTPGMILSSKALLDRNPQPNDEDIKTALAGSFCRCTGYAKILEAVRAARDGDVGNEGS